MLAAPALPEAAPHAPRRPAAAAARPPSAAAAAPPRRSSRAGSAERAAPRPLAARPGPGRAAIFRASQCSRPARRGPRGSGEALPAARGALRSAAEPRVGAAPGPLESGAGRLVCPGGGSPAKPAPAPAGTPGDRLELESPSGAAVTRRPRALGRAGWAGLPHGMNCASAAVPARRPRRPQRYFKPVVVTRDRENLECLLRNFNFILKALATE
nr:translation initiation factor IF-2-like [Equus asinus]